MKCAGIDVGSRTVKLVVVDDGKLTFSKIRENSFDPLRLSRELLEETTYDRLVATGYGRHLISDKLGCDVISEIKACAIGARNCLPTARTILDIGGQDVKAITLEESGRLAKFEMNDKCAAGTGRFLEIMAMALGSSLSEFSSLARSASRAETINSMCTVYAESEVISAVGRGGRRNELALGIHEAVVRRTANMMKRVGIEDDIVFVGGAALNPCLHELLQKTLGRSVLVPDEPQMVAALGCALLPVEATTAVG